MTGVAFGYTPKHQCCVAVGGSGYRQHLITTEESGTTWSAHAMPDTEDLPHSRLASFQRRLGCFADDSTQA